MTDDLRGARIGLVTASASRLGGGVFEAVVAHAEMVARLGGQAHVFALADTEASRDAPRLACAQVHLFDVAGPRQIGFAPGLTRGLLAADVDCLHLHGIWMYPSAAASRWARLTGKPYFISPHGMLDPWITARGKLKKAIARLAYERRSWRRATALHALTSAEAEDIRREAGRSDTVVVPNAGPAAVTGGPRWPDPIVLYIGRIHPKKNLVALVEGWLAAERPQGARLVIAGWGDEGSVAELNQAIDRAGEAGVGFVGPVFGEDKARLLASARFVILPSHSEGLPMAILEAWAQGTPTIMTAQCNLPEGYAAGAALPCGHDAPAIATALSKALRLTGQEWARMSHGAVSLAGGHFSQQAVARRWEAIYADALGYGAHT